MNARQAKRQAAKQHERRVKEAKREMSKRYVDLAGCKDEQKAIRQITELVDKAEKEMWDKACIFTLKSVYAAVMRGAKDEFGFGPERVRRLLVATDKYVISSFDAEDEIQEAWEKVGLQIVFRNDPANPMESRIQEKDEKDEKEVGAKE